MDDQEYSKCCQCDQRDCTVKLIDIGDEGAYFCSECAQEVEYENIIHYDTVNNFNCL